MNINVYSTREKVARRLETERWSSGGQTSFHWNKSHFLRLDNQYCILDKDEINNVSI